MLYSLFREKKQQCVSSPTSAAHGSTQPKQSGDGANTIPLLSSLMFEDFDSALQRARREALGREATTPIAQVKARSQNTVEMSPAAFSPYDFARRDGSEPPSFGVFRMTHSVQDEPRRLGNKAMSIGGSMEMLELSGRANEVVVDPGSAPQSRDTYGKGARSVPSEHTGADDGVRNICDDFSQADFGVIGGSRSFGGDFPRNNHTEDDESESHRLNRRTPSNERNSFRNVEVYRDPFGVQHHRDLSSSDGASDLGGTLRPSAGNSFLGEYPYTVFTAFVIGMRVRAALESSEGKSLRTQIVEINALLTDIERSEKTVAPSSTLPPAPTGPLVKQRRIWVDQLIALVNRVPLPVQYWKRFMQSKREQYISSDRHGNSESNRSHSAENERFVGTTENLPAELKFARPRKMLRRGDGTRRILQRSQEIIAKSAGDSVELAPSNSRSKSTEENETIQNAQRTKVKKNPREVAESTAPKILTEKSIQETEKDPLQSSRMRKRNTPSKEEDVPAKKIEQLSERQYDHTFDPSNEANSSCIPSPYSSVEAEQRSRQIENALRSVVLGPKKGTEKGGLPSTSGNSVASSLGGANVTSIVSAQFLSERRAVFLQTLFREPTEGTGAAKEKEVSGFFYPDGKEQGSIPRLDAKKDWPLFCSSNNNNTEKNSNSWFLSGGYHETRRTLEALGL